MSEAHVFAEGAWGIVFANEKALGKAKKNAVPPGGRKVFGFLRSRNEIAPSRRKLMRYIK